MTGKPTPIDLAPFAQMLGGSREFLRAWSREDGASLTFVNPRPLGADPAALGLALIDVIRQGAATYARATGISEQDALARIWEGLDAGRDAPAGNDQPLSAAMAKREDD